MFKWLLSFFLGKSPLDTLAGIWTKYKDSEIASERIAAQEAKDKMDALLAEQQAALSVRMASMGFWEMRLLTAVTLACFVFHLALITIDTCFTSVDLRIPAFPPPIDQWEGTIILSLFGISAGERSVRSIAAAIAVRKK